MIQWDKPYDDEYLVYNAQLHKYVLTRRCALEIMGIDLQSIFADSPTVNKASECERFLIKVSNTVYNYIYQFSMRREWTEYVLACLTSLRERMSDMLKAQLEYVLTNGFISDYSGVSVGKGVVTDGAVLRSGMKVADEIVQFCNEEIPELGYSLSYAGRVPIVPIDKYRRGY